MRRLERAARTTTTEYYNPSLNTAETRQEVGSADALFVTQLKTILIYWTKHFNFDIPQLIVPKEILDIIIKYTSNTMLPISMNLLGAFYSPKDDSIILLPGHEVYTPRSPFSF